jgi:hypothetical protein
LVTVTAKVMISPTLGVSSLTVLVTTRSACWGVSVTLALLLFGSGSNWSASPTVAVLVSGSSLSTRAVMINVSGLAVLTVPTSHKPVALS